MSDLKKHIQCMSPGPVSCAKALALGWVPGSVAEKQCFDGDELVDNASLQCAEEREVDGVRACLSHAPLSCPRQDC